MKTKFAYISANRIGHQTLETCVHYSWCLKNNYSLVVFYSPNAISQDFTNLEGENIRFFNIPVFIWRVMASLFPFLIILRAATRIFSKKLYNNFYNFKIGRFHAEWSGFVFDFFFYILGLQSRPFDSRMCFEYNGYNSLEDYYKPFKLSDKAEESCYSILENELGIKKGEKFVCLHVRESSYLNDNDREWKNSTFDNYISTIEYLKEKNIKVIRMGTNLMSSQKDIPGLIDYATSSSQSILMDLFLSGKCYFFIGNMSGVSLLPIMLGTFNVFVNVFPVCYYGLKGKSTVIYKHVFSNLLKRNLSLIEVLNEQQLCYYSTDREYDDIGLKIENNSSAEILQITIETIDYIENNYYSTFSKEELSFLEFLEKSIIEKVNEQRNLITMFNIGYKFHIGKKYYKENYNNSKLGE